MNELPPDPHLQAALRHAPDARVEAPPEIAARVLAEARRAVAPAATPPWWARWWERAGAGWMPQGAFATLVLAGLITLLWRDDRPGPAVESAPVAESPAPALGPANPPAVAELAAVASAPAAVPSQNRMAARARAAETAQTDAAQQAARQAKATDAAQAARLEQAERRLEAPPQLSPVPLPPPPAAPAPPAPAPATAVATEAAPRPLGQAPAAAAANRMALAALASAPWGDPPGPADRVRQPGLEGSAGHVDATWLAALTRSVAAPWQDTSAPPPAGEPTLVWERDGAPYGRLWIERREARSWVLWCGAAAAESRCQQAPLRGEAPALPR